MRVTFQIGDIVTWKESSERLVHQQGQGWIKACDDNIGEIIDEEHHGCDIIYTIRRRKDDELYIARPSEIKKIDVGVPRQ